NRRTLLQVHRNGDSGSPRVVGSTSASRSATNVRSLTIASLRPAPAAQPAPMVRRAPIPSAPSDSARPHAGCHRHRGNATITRRKRLRRRDQTTAPFVEKRRYCRKPLLDEFNIDHTTTYCMLAWL